jgi:Fe-S cluster biogenesis protein NfuA
MKKITTEEIERILDESVRFRLRMHGGGIHLVDITPEGTARFRLTGACAGCPGASRTMEEVVEETLRKHIPGLRRIEVVHGISEELLEEARRFLGRSENGRR